MNIPRTKHARITRMLAKGLTQTAIAETVGVSRYCVSQVKLGKATFGRVYPKAKPTKRATAQKAVKKAAKKRGTRKAATRRLRR